ncbi:MAG: terminase small subunit, Nu1 [endosymbiont of Seepiophila jonesi]|uniref:Terminase small subunit, Nu1 n=1 Tax=endosymbiont of Lamellibrachia luymesi TaxID=2200907 RepID=A0A370D756_9GAMM|nr:MAG: terminase small subunit, Nu1 [endosymbiont of Lamellibrachia luymesi]RDH89755.1 MAG: terminase small subunit, Nu1 [endosymbiont of Seepiophila jonesi]
MGLVGDVVEIEIDDKTTVPVFQLANLLDLDPRRVQQLSGEDVVAKADRGSYYLARSVRGNVSYLRDRVPHSGKGRGNYGTEHVRLISAKANLAELEEMEKRGELTLVDQVEAAAFDAARKAQEALISIPDRLAAVVAAETDPTAVHKLMEKEILVVCSMLAKVAEEEGDPQ